MTVRYCVNIYREKATHLENLFTRETLKLFDKFNKLRNNLHKRNVEIDEMLHKMVLQETIIIELREFIHEH